MHWMAKKNWSMKSRKKSWSFAPHLKLVRLLRICFFVSGHCFSQFCVRFCVSVRSCFSNFCVLFDVSGHWFSVFCVWTVALWKCRSSQYCAASQARLSCPPCLVILFTVLHSRVRIFFKIKVIIALVVCSAWERCQCMVKVHPIQSQSIFCGLHLLDSCSNRIVL